MGRLVVQQNVSLDGYAADGSGEPVFVADPEDWRALDTEELAWLGGVERVLLGAETYRMFSAFWPGETGEIIADRLNGLPKSVFSSTLPAAPWGRWEPARLERGDAIPRIAELKAQSEGDLVLWGSLSLMRTALRARLVDRVELRVMPVVLAGGRPLFAEPLEGELLGCRRFGQLAVLDYALSPSGR